MSSISARRPPADGGVEENGEYIPAGMKTFTPPRPGMRHLSAASPALRASTGSFQASGHPLPNPPPVTRGNVGRRGGDAKRSPTTARAGDGKLSVPDRPGRNSLPVSTQNTVDPMHKPRPPVRNMSPKPSVPPRGHSPAVKRPNIPPKPSEPKPSPPPKPANKPAKPPKPANKPRLPPKPQQDMSFEDAKVVFESLKKYYNANKQLGLLANVASNKAQCLTNVNADTLKKQLELARTQLQSSNNELTTLVRATAKSASGEAVIGLLNLVMEVAKGCSYACASTKSIAIEASDEKLFKQSLTAITTAREAVGGLLEVLQQHTEYLGNAVVTQLEACLKTVEQSIGALVSSRSGKLITTGRLLELEAASRSAVTAVSKLVGTFKLLITKNVLTAAKVASCTVAQLNATLNETATKNDNMLAIPEVKQWILEAANAVKDAFNTFMETTKEEVSSTDSGSHSRMQEAMEPLRALICDTLTKIEAIAEVDTSESQSIKLSMIKPTDKMRARAEKVASIPDPLVPPAPEQESQRRLDIPDNAVPDIDPIWDEPEEDTEDRIMYSAPDQLKCATLNKLIRQLSSEKSPDMKFVKTFITTYQSFTTPETLLKKLIQRFHVPEEKRDIALPIQLRTCNALKQWVETSYLDFSPEFLATLDEFLSELSNHKSYHKYSTQITQQINKVMSQDTELETSDIINLTIESKIPLSPANLLYVFNEEEIARQLTLVDYRIYQNIQPVELLNCAWSKDKYKYRAKNVLSLVARSTSLTMWVASMVLWQDSLKDRIRALTKLINVAMHLRKLNNFNSVMAVLAGINTSAVYRLKHTKAALSQQSQQIFQELQDLMDPTSAYGTYRQTLRTVNPPLVPFLGTYLTDITFIEDGNPDYINGLINYRKRELVYNVIQEIQQYQQTGYEYELVDNIAHFLTELPICDNDDDLYKLSLAREPRGATADQIL